MLFWRADGAYFSESEFGQYILQCTKCPKEAIEVINSVGAGLLSPSGLFADAVLYERVREGLRADEYGLGVWFVFCLFPYSVFADFKKDADRYDGVVTHLFHSQLGNLVADLEFFGMSRDVEVEWKKLLISRYFFQSPKIGSKHHYLINWVKAYLLVQLDVSRKFNLGIRRDCYAAENVHFCIDLIKNVFQGFFDAYDTLPQKSKTFFEQFASLVAISMVGWPGRAGSQFESVLLRLVNTESLLYGFSVDSMDESETSEWATTNPLLEFVERYPRFSELVDARLDFLASKDGVSLSGVRV